MDMKDEATPAPELRGQEMFREQEVVMLLCKTGGIEAGFVRVIEEYKRLLVGVGTLALFSDSAGAEPPEATSHLALSMHKSMHESLTQARFRLQEVGGWLATAAEERRMLARALAQPKPAPAPPEPETLPEGWNTHYIPNQGHFCSGPLRTFGVGPRRRCIPPGKDYCASEAEAIALVRRTLAEEAAMQPAEPKPKPEPETDEDAHSGG